MSNKNIYDIAISELIARDGGGSSTGGSGVTTLNVSIDTASLIALGAAIPNPINVTSSLSGIPSGWALQASSHIIYYKILAGAFNPLATGSSDSLLGADTTGGTSGVISDTVEREYYSVVTLYEIVTPANTVSISSAVISIVTANSIHYGFSNSIPTNTNDLSESILVGNSILSIASNNAFENFYIALPDASAQPVAIADEHGLISSITEYPLEGAISNFTTYKFKWPIKLVGTHLHTFTLIFS